MSTPIRRSRAWTYTATSRSWRQADHRSRKAEHLPSRCAGHRHRRRAIPLHRGAGAPGRIGRPGGGTLTALKPIEQERSVDDWDLGADVDRSPQLLAVDRQCQRPAHTHVAKQWQVEIPEIAHELGPPNRWVHAKARIAGHAAAAPDWPSESRRLRRSMRSVNAASLANLSTTRSMRGVSR